MEIFLFFLSLGLTRREKNTNWAGNSIHLVMIINKSGHIYSRPVSLFFLSLMFFGVHKVRVIAYITQTRSTSIIVIRPILNRNEI